MTTKVSEMAAKPPNDGGGRGRSGQRRPLWKERGAGDAVVSAVMVAVAGSSGGGCWWWLEAAAGGGGGL